MSFGGVHARREGGAVLEPDLVGERFRLRGPERVERARQEAAEQVVVLERECERGVERTGEVALRRPSGGAHGAVDGRLGDFDHEVAATGELLQVVTGDIRVEFEMLGHRAGGDAGGAGVTCEEIDLAPGGVAERIGDRAHHRGELVRGEGS